MSLRHREVIYAQQQRESELLSKLRACSHFLQNSLSMITYDNQEKKSFKINVSKFLNETIALGSEDTDSSDSHDDIMNLNSQHLSQLQSLPSYQPIRYQYPYQKQSQTHQNISNENMLPLNHNINNQNNNMNVLNNNNININNNNMNINNNNNLLNRADISISEYLAHQLGENNQIYCSDDPNKILDYQLYNQNQSQYQQNHNYTSTNDLLGDHNNFFEVLSPESKRSGDWDDSNLYHARKKQHFENNENLDQFQTSITSNLSLPPPNQPQLSSELSSTSSCPFADFTSMLTSTSSIITNDYSDTFHPISSLSISSHNTAFNVQSSSSNCESPTDSIGYSSTRQCSVSNPSSPSNSISSHQSSLYNKLSSGIPPSMTIPQTCSVSNGPLACLPNSATGILDVMFTLSSEVNPSTSVNGIISSQQHQQHQHLYSNNIPLNPYSGSLTTSYSSSSSGSLLQPISSLSATSASVLLPSSNTTTASTSSSMLLNSGQSMNSTISTNDNIISSSRSTNIADVMAWIKNNPLKTTKRYN